MITSNVCALRSISNFASENLISLKAFKRVSNCCFCFDIVVDFNCARSSELSIFFVALSNLILPFFAVPRALKRGYLNSSNESDALPKISIFAEIFASRIFPKAVFDTSKFSIDTSEFFTLYACLSCCEKAMFMFAFILLSSKFADIFFCRKIIWFCFDICC